MRSNSYFFRTTAIIALFVGALPVAGQAKPIAIFINFGDGGAQDAELQRTSARAQQAFSKQGYDFITVKPSANIRQDIEAAMKKASQGNHEEIVILTHGHGEIVDTPLDSQSYPKVPSRGGVYSDQPRAFMFMNGRYEDRYSEANSKEYQTRHVGSGDFANWIKEIKNENPNAPVRMVMGQCFSGNAARVLNKIPGVQAFSSTTDQEKAHTYPNRSGQQTSFLDYYVAEVDANGPLRDDAQSLALFEKSREKWLAFSSPNPKRLAEVPWSPVDAKINSWCADGRALTSRLTEQDAAVNALTLKYEKKSGADFAKIEKCETGNKLAKNKEGFELALKSLEKINEELKLRIEDLTLAQFKANRERLSPTNSFSPQIMADFARIQNESDLEKLKGKLSSDLDKSLDCYQTNKSTQCGVYGNHHAIAEIIGDKNWSSDQIEICTTETEANIAPCLNGVNRIYKNRLGISSSTVRRVLTRTIRYAFEACGAQRAQYYQSCYEKFWASDSSPAQN